MFDCPGPLPPGQTRARPALARVGVHPRGGQQVGVNMLLSTDRCAAKCRPSRDLKIASRHFLPFSIPCISRAEDSDAGYDRDDDWKPKVGTDNI